MKRYFITITTSILALSVISCKKSYLNIIPDNIATLDLAFSNRLNVERYLYNIYYDLPAGEEQSFYLSGGDEIWYPSYAIEQLWSNYRLAAGQQSASSPLYNYWGTYYISIRRANTLLDNIDGVLGVRDDEKTRWRGEALFLKAYFHFLLVQMYGPIIIEDKALPTTESSVVSERNTVDECFEYILKTIDDSIQYLPDILPAEASEKGRITKPIALAIKARVWMTYASPFFNGNSVMATFRNTRGEPFFNPSVDESRWVSAAQACKEAIDACEAQGRSLLNTNNVRIPGSTNTTMRPDVLRRAALRSRVTERENNTEAIFISNSAATNGLQSASMPRLAVYSQAYSTTNNRYAPPLKIAEMYYSKNGVPIDEDKTYPYSNRYNTKTSQPNTEDANYVASGQISAILNFDREPRFYADLDFDRALHYFNGRNNNNPWVIQGRAGEATARSEPGQYSSTGYWSKKLVNPQTVVQNGNSFNAYRYGWPIIRLADLYLYYAEALNESNNPSEAVVYLDRVRERAGLRGVVESWRDYSRNPDKPNTKDGLRDIIQRERLIEMAFEGDRFFDLRRWRLSEAYLNQPITGWNIDGSSAADYYAPQILFSQTFFPRDYLWPLSINEINKAPQQLIQNPGWNY